MVQSGKIGFIENGATTSDLVCPRCGSTYLRHTGATFYQRGEDADELFVIEVDGNRIGAQPMPAAHSGNPSARRHGMAIVFSCEGCSADHGPLKLTIAQHKGCTEIGWRYKAEP